jgi:predicted oxidoreductase
MDGGFECEAFVRMLRAHAVALVGADTAGDVAGAGRDGVHALPAALSEVSRRSA